MKKIISLVICMVIVFSSLGISSLASSEITPYYNNVADVETQFNIDSNGTARVIVFYDGDPDTITGATIKIKIQKQFLFFFWTDVVEWIDESNDSYHMFVHSIQVDSGTYKATIEYTIRGTGGEPDVITDTIERSH